MLPWTCSYSRCNTTDQEAIPNNQPQLMNTILTEEKRFQFPIRFQKRIYFSMCLGICITRPRCREQDSARPCVIEFTYTTYMSPCWPLRWAMLSIAYEYTLGLLHMGSRGCRTFLASWDAQRWLGCIDVNMAQGSPEPCGAVRYPVA